MGLLELGLDQPGLKAVWITPLRSLAADTWRSLIDPLEALGLNWKVEMRTGDTSGYTKAKQLKELPDVLITTPESLTIMLSLKASAELFGDLSLVVVDEWHELLGSKRGVQTELALARLRRLSPELMTWGLSATLGNTEEAAAVLAPTSDPVIVRGESGKEIAIDSLLPPAADRFPWAGHMGSTMVPLVVQAIDEVESALVFTNTRAQAEIWHKAILDSGAPWVDRVALHHGSLDAVVRAEAEEGLKEGRLRAVVCTSSLDLGVDFSPVDRVFQVGSPKGVARLLQRAGRSGHRPGVPSRVTCVPTHAWELLDIAAAREGAHLNRIEGRAPISRPLDVLSQHVVSMALAGGFRSSDLLEEVRTTWSYRDLSDEEWEWALDFVTRGGDSLRAYPEFRKVIIRGYLYVVEDAKIAKRHRMNVGTIVSDAAMSVKFVSGAPLGTVEEQFVARLRKGDVFMFAGRPLAFVRVKDMTCWVRLAKAKNVVVPRWMGGRLPLSSQLALTAREKLRGARDGELEDPELQFMAPILSVQADWSAIPGEDELLVETYYDREGTHVFIYPIEGRLVHEGIAALVAHRLARETPMTLSLACNDYGFELSSPSDFRLDEETLRELLSPENLVEDILGSLNASEMARRQFREIARIAGLILQSYPGQKSTRQVQASSGLLFDVFQKYDPLNPLLKQADREVLDRNLEETRLAACLRRLSESQFVMTAPPRFTPMAFPILVDRLRDTVATETADSRIQRMVAHLEKAAATSDS
jgi:ATP-dependent Lhr-like helicase